MATLAPFADIERMVNAGVLGTLANATASVAGGEPFAVLFDRPYAAPFDAQVDAASPECLGPAEKLGALQRGDAISIDGVAFRVVTAEPDGTGMSLLTLSEGA